MTHEVKQYCKDEEVQKTSEDVTEVTEPIFSEADSVTSSSNDIKESVFSFERNNIFVFMFPKQR